MSSAPLRITTCLSVSLVLLVSARPTEQGDRSRDDSVSHEDSRGAVIAVGGGGTPEVALHEAVRLAKKRFDLENITVIVIPHASQREDRGVGSAAMWGEAPGVEAATVLPDDPADARAAIAAAHIVWMGGGSQSRLLDHLAKADLTGALEDAHERGAVIGGTSAGAAVLGSTTIFGRPDPVSYTAGSVDHRPGLGLVPDAIVDQHFREREREGRLITAVLDAGKIVGFGISERTALVFDGGAVRVLGEGPVIVIDAREAEAGTREEDTSQTATAALSATGMALHVLAPGQQQEIARAQNAEDSRRR